MKLPRILSLVTLALWASALSSPGEVKTTVAHNDSDHATGGFKFATVPAPSRSDAATRAQFTIVDGERDGNGGDLDVLHDGKVPTEEDQPAENFFFNAGTPGGRILADLGKVIEVQQVNTYSWHPGSRGPQVYRLFASEGKADGFNSQPKGGLDPETCGWKLVAKIDTRPSAGEGGGQYGVSTTDSTGALGKFRYLLFDISRTESDDGFGNTFYSEIDVIDRDAPAATTEAAVASSTADKELIEADGGKYQISLDTSETPDLTDWAHKELVPMVREWYPKIVAMLPSEGFEAPRRFSITFRKDMQGVAATGGTRISCAANWFRQNLKGEAVGAVFHEMVHVVQQYGGGRRNNPNATRTPGWVTEGIPDYIRWFLYEPQSHGAEITKRNLGRARYDGMYRITANFMNFVVENYDRGLIEKLNAAARAGRYTDDLWKTQTGKTLTELNDLWKTSLEQKIAADAAANSLTDAEKAAGWKLLFNGTDFTGWHNFKREGVRPGWQVKDGALVCADPHNAGDIVTADKYGWFELQLDYNISEAGNSGIIFHVTDEGGAVWATGPEFQLEDNQKAADPVRCGWLYALYQPPIDPKTQKPLDATKPVGQWNHVRLLVSPEKCEHEINGVKYFEYVLGSEDFKARVARSKFARMPLFAKASSGYLALQGDHGQVSFRNIKIRELEPKQ